MADWRDGAADRLESNETPINVGRLMNELNIAMADDDILVADGGFAGHWGGLLFDTKTAGRHFLADRGFASIGYGVPGAHRRADRRRAEAPRRRPDRRRRLQHDASARSRRRAASAPTSCRASSTTRASGYVKALQHAVYGPGNYQSSDLAETDYAADRHAPSAATASAWTTPSKLAGAIREGLANTDSPTVLDVIVTRDPARMLPAADNRTLRVEKGDRPV